MLTLDVLIYILSHTTDYATRRSASLVSHQWRQAHTLLCRDKTLYAKHLCATPYDKTNAVDDPDALPPPVYCWYYFNVLCWPWVRSLRPCRCRSHCNHHHHGPTYRTMAGFQDILQWSYFSDGKQRVPWLLLDNPRIVLPSTRLSRALTFDATTRHRLVAGKTARMRSIILRRPLYVLTLQGPHLAAFVNIIHVGNESPPVITCTVDYAMDCDFEWRTQKFACVWTTLPDFVRQVLNVAAHFLEEVLVDTEYWDCAKRWRKWERNYCPRMTLATLQHAEAHTGRE